MDSLSVSPDDLSEAATAVLRLADSIFNRDFVDEAVLASLEVQSLFVSQVSFPSHDVFTNWSEHGHFQGLLYWWNVPSAILQQASSFPSQLTWDTMMETFQTF